MAATAPLFDAAQLTPFLEGQDYMALTNRIRLQLALEGITVPDDFIDIDADGLEGIFLNLQKPPKVPATGVAAIAAGRLHKIMAYEVSAKSKMRLKGTQKIAKFYENVGRDLDPQNMTWLVIKTLPGAMEGVDGAQEGGLWSSPLAYKTPSCSQVDGINGTVPWTEGGSLMHMGLGRGNHASRSPSSSGGQTTL